MPGEEPGWHLKKNLWQKVATPNILHHTFHSPMHQNTELDKDRINLVNTDCLKYAQIGTDTVLKCVTTLCDKYLYVVINFQTLNIMCNLNTGKLHLFSNCW